MPETKYFSAKDLGESLFEELLHALTIDDDAKRPIDFADIARIAIGVSLIAGEFGTVESKQWDRNGKEFNNYSLDNDNVLKNSCAIAHKLTLDDEGTIRRLMESHMNRGLEDLRQLWSESDGDKVRFVELIASILPEDKTRGCLVSAPEEIKVYIGETSALRSEPLFVSVNAEGGDRANPHVAIAGGSGVGKTQLLLSMLSQALEQSPDSGCILFDYKGDISRGTNWDSLERSGFEKYTLGEKPYPINPLRLPAGSKPELVAQEFAETCQVHNRRLGPRQLGFIRKALSAVYLLTNAARAASGEDYLAPSLEDLRKSLLELYEEEGRESDMVTELFDQLATFHLFEDGSGLSVPEFLGRRVVLDVSKQSAFRELSTFFVLHFILQGMRTLGEAPVQEGEGVRYRALRSIIAIDEADKYLSVRPKPIYEILRMGRSFGVCMWLSSQSIADYESDKDDFVNNVETWFLFQQGKLPSTSSLAGLLKVQKKKAKVIADALPGLPQQRCFYRHKGIPTEIVAAQLYKKEEWPV